MPTAIYSREKGEGQAAGLPFPFFARIYTKNGPISQISEARGAETPDFLLKTRFKVNFQKYQGKLWRGFQISQVKTADFFFSPSIPWFDKKNFFRLFYWLKTVGILWASTPCNQKMGILTGTWRKWGPKIQKKTKIFFHGLWGLKSKEIARAFTSRNKIEGFLLETPFSYFLGTFWHFLAISVNFGPRLVYDSSKWSERVGRSFFAIKFAFLWLCQTLARIWLKFDRVKKTQIRLNVVNALLFPTVLSYHTLV